LVAPQRRPHLEFRPSVLTTTPTHRLNGSPHSSFPPLFLPTTLLAHRLIPNPLFPASFFLSVFSVSLCFKKPRALSPVAASDLKVPIPPLIVLKTKEPVRTGLLKKVLTNRLLAIGIPGS
jgi:hypothetical protein